MVCFFVVFNVILLLFVNHLKDFFVIYRLPDYWYYPWNHRRTYDLSLDFSQQFCIHLSLCIYIYIYNYYKNSISQPVLQLGTPLLCNHWAQVSYVIQIKICAEYRDMLPRPRLVCQEPGLMPIGRSPGVPDKSSRGLGSMPRYSAHILICFKAYIFLIFFIPLWVWLGTLQDCQYAQCPLPLSIVIRMRLVIRQWKLPACLAEVQLAHQNTLWHLSHSLVKMTDTMDEICINGKFSAQEPSEWRYFSIPVSNFTVFQPII